MAADTGRLAPLRAHGPWLVDEAGSKVILKGVTYGPFAPNPLGEPWPRVPQLHADLAQIRQLGFNTVRIYEPPTPAVLRACESLGLRLLCGIPWSQHVDFIADRAVRDDAFERVLREAARLRHEPSVVGLLVGNEIEKTLVRWMGPRRAQRFIEDLVEAARQAAPGKLVSYASYPSTEYLVPRNADFAAFNVFLEQRDDFARYLQRLQRIASGRPLVITEFGLDTLVHGEATQHETLLWQRDVCERAAIAGNFWFSYTDEWHRGGKEVTEWSFGIVTADRTPKAIGADLGKEASVSSSVNLPKISVVVCTHNGASTLRACLAALEKQSHPGYEVIVIDDGSTDTTAEIARAFPRVHYERQEHAGLGAARNRGAQLARGEVIAYTDDDCIPDEDWLKHLGRAFEDPRCMAAGGPNLPPAPHTFVEAVVALAPGAPSEVLLNDEEAEHLPGCNLAVRRSGLLAIGGFHEVFTAAGDDVDVCWRLQAHGGKLCFVPSAVVWHHRRSTTRAYLRQQSGYGFAEALLIRHHPKRFAWIGGAQWQGAIYGHPAKFGLVQGQIHFGQYGLAPFQCVYQSPEEAAAWNQCNRLGWWVTALAFLIAGMLSTAFCFAGAVMLAISWLAAWSQAAKARPPSWRHRALLAWMILLQPLVRDAARWRGILRLHARPRGRWQWTWPKWPGDELTRTQVRLRRFRWTGSGRSTRLELLEAILTLAERWRIQKGRVVDPWDLLLISSRGSLFFLRTVTEYHSRNFTVTYLEFSAPALQILRIPRLIRDQRELLSLINDAAKRAHLHRTEGAMPDRPSPACPSDKSPLDSECNSGEISQA
jgi:GT2 family glycosyltransferase